MQVSEKGHKPNVGVKKQKVNELRPEAEIMQMARGMRQFVALNESLGLQDRFLLTVLALFYLIITLIN